MCFRLLYNALALTQALLIARCLSVFSFDKSQMRKKKRKTTTSCRMSSTTRSKLSGFTKFTGIGPLQCVLFRDLG